MHDVPNEFVPEGSTADETKEEERPEDAIPDLPENQATRDFWRRRRASGCPWASREDDAVLAASDGHRPVIENVPEPDGQRGFGGVAHRARGPHGDGTCKQAAARGRVVLRALV